MANINGWRGHPLWGPNGGELFLSGAMPACISNVGLWLVVVGIGTFLEWWRPDRPKCKSGRCYSDDYDYIGFPPHELTERERQLTRRFDALIVRCRCGTTYLRSKKLRKFMEVLPDGSVSPYMCYEPFGRQWKLDRASENSG